MQNTLDSSQVCKPCDIILGLCLRATLWSLSRGMFMQQRNAASMQGNPEEQLRALRTLAGMAKQKASAVPVAAVQCGVRELGAFRPLMRIISTMMPRKDVRNFFLVAITVTISRSFLRLSQLRAVGRQQCM